MKKNSIKFCNGVRLLYNLKTNRLRVKKNGAAVMETKKKKKTEIEKIMLNKVEEVINSINVAKHVDQLILSLHSLASLLFPLDSRAFSGHCLFLF